MSRVQFLTNSRDSLSVKFLEFTRIVSKDKGRVAVFFEGEDEKYYAIRINSFRPDIRWSGVNCKGKANVIELRSRIRKHATYERALCIFFIDADFDCNSDVHGFPDVYITPCYSVENFYFSEDTLKRVLTAEFGVSEFSDERSCYEKVIREFSERRSEYVLAISGFNFLVRELRLMESSGSLDGRMNINNLSISDLIDLELGECVSKKYDEFSPRKLFPELPEELELSLSRSEEFFRDKDLNLWFRGKNHLEFIRVFLCKLKEDRCRKNDRVVFNKKGNVKLQITKVNCISELSQYADTPECLRVFLEEQRLSLGAVQKSANREMHPTL